MYPGQRSNHLSGSCTIICEISMTKGKWKNVPDGTQKTTLRKKKKWLCNSTKLRMHFKLEPRN